MGSLQSLNHNRKSGKNKGSGGTSACLSRGVVGRAGLDAALAPPVCDCPTLPGVADCGSGQNLRIIYRTDEEAVLVLEVFQKQTKQTPQAVVEVCRRRTREYDAAGGGTDG
jgi:hypothetical protein